MSDHSCKLLVIGGGPGGYICAIRASQLNIETILVERENLGGTCLNVGCIPSKAVIHAADEFHAVNCAGKDDSPIGISTKKPTINYTKTLKWKDGIVSRLNHGVSTLLSKANVKTIAGNAHFIDGKSVVVENTEGSQTITAEHIVIATGSVPIELPHLPFEEPVCSSTELLSIDKIPKKLVVVGGGYIGLELGTAFSKLGSEVTIVEAGNRILPQYDEALTKPASSRLNDLGIKVLLNTNAISIDKNRSSLLVRDSKDEEQELVADKILVTVGRKPATEGLSLENLAVDMNGAFIGVDEKCETSMRGLYAIGDVTGNPMLAHRAMAQGEMVAELIAGKNRVWDKKCIPEICFTDPEIVSVGMSLDEAKKQSFETKTGVFPFKANGRAMTVEREDGFIRVVARADNHEILGIHAVGENISELATTFALAIEMAARLEDVAYTIHAHPLRSEGFQEAALQALGRALHI